MRKYFFVSIFLLVFTGIGFSRINIFRLIKYGTYSQTLRVFRNRANVNKRFSNRLNATPLHFTAIFDKYKIAKLLISKGAEIEAKDRGGKTPLHTAAFWGSYKVAKLLILKGAKVNATTTEANYTPLHYASGAGYSGKANYQIVKLLLANGANVNAKRKHAYKAGWTSLHFAAKAGLKKIGRLLINNGADVNSKGGFKGETPLHIAVAEARLGFVKMLISKGANVNAKSKKGYTPFDYAKFFQRNRKTVKRIQALLKRHGGRSGIRRR